MLIISLTEPDRRFTVAFAMIISPAGQILAFEFPVILPNETVDGLSGTMHVEAAIDGPLIFVGDTLSAKITFTPNRARRRSSVGAESGSGPMHLLGGYAIVQGIFRLGDQILPDGFEATRNCGVVVGSHGIEYSANFTQHSGLLGSVWGGLRNLVARPQGLDDEDALDTYPVYNTAQQLLFTDLVVTEPHSFDFVVDLPASLPPTYRSKAITISYQLVVGFQRLDDGSPVSTQLFLPFRLYPHGSAPAFDLTRPITPETTAVAPPQGMAEFIESFSASPTALPATKEPAPQLSYNIAKNGDQIATLHFARSPMRIGDAVEAVVKLAQPCLHLTAYLELGELIDASMAAGTPQTFQTFSRQALVTTALDEVALHLPLLHGTTPLLNTKQIQASWSLRLEFVALNGDYYSSENAAEKVAKAHVDSELFSCRLPLTVLAPDAGGHGTSKLWIF